jgi:predicted PolB exonuclease-like 3'-5' exonuclease
MFRNFSQSSIVVFDIETIPDADEIRRYRVNDTRYDGLNDEDLIQLAFKDQREKTSSDFLSIIYHKIVSLSVLHVTPSTMELITFGDNVPEEEIVKSFFYYLNAYAPKLVSYNGRRFDIPLLLTKALKHNIDCTGYYERTNPSHKKTRSTNYRTKFEEDFNIDVYESITQFNSLSGFTLDAVSKYLGLTGKPGIDGSEVYSNYLNGNKQKIQEYCESDVLSTYYTFLKFSFVSGKISIAEFESEVKRLSDYIDEKHKNKIYSTSFEILKKDNNVTTR